MVQVHACGPGKRHRSSGFTMIEVLVVATMLAIAILYAALQLSALVR